MKSKLSQGDIRIYFFLLSAILILYLPILSNPSIILNRGNDLEEQFWPVFYLINKIFWENHLIPLWNNLWFSGMPLLSDPQFSLFYPGNFVYYFFPTDVAIIIYLLIHSLLGGIGTYLASKLSLHLSKKASIFAGVLFIFLPKSSGFLEAGHIGLVGSLAWSPFILLGVLKLTQKPEIKWTVLLGIAYSGLFFTHTINFLIISFTSVLFFFVSFFLVHTKKVAAFVLFFLAGSLTFGLTAITLLPQLEWLPTTTRSLLLKERIVYPVWTGIFEFLKNIFIPWYGGLSTLWEIDTEKWLAIGLIPACLAIFGFFKLSIKLKVLIIISCTVISLIALNNSSPISNLLTSIDLFVLSRVSTRIWVIIVLLIVFLSAFGFDKLKLMKKRLAYSIILLAIIESLFISWLRLAKPIPIQNEFAPEEVYKFLSMDKNKFRVFCVTRCLSQHSAVIYKLELIEGYNTLQQKNYFDQFIQLSQVYWDKYTLSLPPFEIYKFRELKPFAPELADYNVKYVISPYKLYDKDLVLKKRIENYFIYENSIVKNRAFFANGAAAKVTIYSPNFIRVTTLNFPSKEFTLSEVWSAGWKAYLNGTDETVILEPKNKLRNVKITQDTKFVDFKYQPKSYTAGAAITSSTLLILCLYWVSKWKKLRE